MRWPPELLIVVAPLRRERGADMVARGPAADAAFSRIGLSHSTFAVVTAGGHLDQIRVDLPGISGVEAILRM